MENWALIKISMLKLLTSANVICITIFILLLFWVYLFLVEPEGFGIFGADTDIREKEN